jgi:hypothetical protein
MTRLLPALILLISITACSKESGSTSLVGKWKQTESYDGRDSIGCQCWTDVNEISATKIEFKADGTQQMTPPLYSSVYICPGTYSIINDTTLLMKNSCGTTPSETTNWFKKEGTTLIIGYYGPGYNYKMKFKKVKAF